jgi:transcriptional regulator with XRE-family HTH domain
VDAAVGAPGFGPLLRRWRLQRGMSQLALALDAEVSTRHLSWLESGKSQPSRAMVLRLARRLDLPLRERNVLLAAAGYAPLYAERALGHPALAPARQALQQLLDAHEPWPALAVDRHWQLLAHNRMLAPLLQGVAPALLAPPLNVLRLSLHPQGLAPAIVNLPAWRAHVLARLQRQCAASGDGVLAALLAELRSLAAEDAAKDADENAAEDATEGTAEPEAALQAVVPLSLQTAAGRLDFITTVTVFGAPHEVTLAEIAVETLLPANADTVARLRALHAALPNP